MEIHLGKYYTGFVLFMIIFIGWIITGLLGKIIIIYDGVNILNIFSLLYYNAGLIVSSIFTYIIMNSLRWEE